MVNKKWYECAICPFSSTDDGYFGKVEIQYEDPDINIRHVVRVCSRCFKSLDSNVKIIQMPEKEIKTDKGILE